MRRSIGDKITVSKTDKELIVKIPGTIEKWMENALLGWVIMWTIMGLYVFYYVSYYELEREPRIFFIVYLAFWAYFEYKSVVSWLFKKYGFELIRVDNEFLYHKVDILGKGKLKRFLLDNVKGMHVNEELDKSMSSVYNKSFWVMGNERIAFQHIDKEAVLGMHLKTNEAKEIVNLINKRIKKRS